MRRAVIRTLAGHTAFDLEEPGDFPSFFVFAMHKSGSTLMNRMLDQALSAAGVPQVPLPSIAFEAGLPANEILNPEELIFPQGYCYRNFHGFPPYLHRFDISGNKKILLIRDPRDIVVSYYFSMAKSHRLPRLGVVKRYLLNMRDKARTANIDQFCRSVAKEFKSQFRSYQSILSTDLRLYRYEDVVFDKKAWLEDMLGYVGVALSPAKLGRIARENDIWPEVERPSKHIRQVMPGNFRKHLSRESIDVLNAEFEPLLTEYKYAI
jgi:Sulfotransferase domain